LGFAPSDLHRGHDSFGHHHRSENRRSCRSPRGRLCRERRSGISANRHHNDVLDILYDVDFNHLDHDSNDHHTADLESLHPANDPAATDNDHHDPFHHDQQFVDDDVHHRAQHDDHHDQPRAAGRAPQFPRRRPGQGQRHQLIPAGSSGRRGRCRRRSGRPPGSRSRGRFR
jgi:hypothetical protein